MKNAQISVLILEVNEAESQLMQHALTSFFSNISVVIFKSVELAILSIKESPDFIILDHFLEGAKGIDSIPLLKDKMPKAKIIVATAQNDIDEFRKAHEFGADIYFKKNKLLCNNIVSFINVNRNFGVN